ncbi:MAG TPA: 1,4-alpha-glucan branching protein GlgB [Acetobacteraceae bacterium]|nr:1,4-alpha-glucan branching protein GlgB [Acetobacteraceae bacterium]
MMDLAPPVAAPLDPATRDALANGRLGDPFAVLGSHDTPEGRVIRAFLPGAERVEVIAREHGHHLAELAPAEPAGLFAARIASAAPYLLRIHWPGAVQETEDPYSFGLLLSDLDLYLFNEGRHFELAFALGARPMTIDGVAGVRFAVWAPNARAVAVVGDFNSWDTRRNPMRLRHDAGVWEVFIPRIEPGMRYKYAIVGPDGRLQPLKADPLARRTEAPPATASIVADCLPFNWHDEAWMTSRGERQRPDKPIAIYEVHAGSWMRPDANDPTRFPCWDDLSARLVPYVQGMGFTHVELMPVAEHPFTGSWGYQPLSLFAPSARYGEPEGFARFVDACHQAGIGVLIDWVPAHFPTDAYGLARFDGTALYEHQDPREGFHEDWNTYIYNLGRREVQGFLIASAIHWLEHYHVDGLRVDAVASMLYRDYSRGPGQWIPNIYGGRENLESITFLRHLNTVVPERCPGAITLAEESTAWPGVTQPAADGGLGFDYKWNMGWMHDTLRYMQHEPIHRRWHHNDMTFGLIYAFSERFVLPLSHDEVVYGKGSLINKMPGDEWQKRANLRAYLGFMWSHPGKKLLFMGGEFGQWREWSHDRELDWWLLDDPGHRGLQRLVRDLNRLYGQERALHQYDAHPAGFRWVVGDDADNSVFAYLRSGAGEEGMILAACNMTPVPREDYRIGVPHHAYWREILNTDSDIYGGSNRGNAGGVHSEHVPAHGQEQSLLLRLPPLATLLFRAGG